MYEGSPYFVVRNPQHTTSHYVGVGLKTVLAYVVFITFLFSVPAAKFIAENVFAKSVDRGVIGETEITIEVLNTEAERIRGLSGRESIPKNHALYFVFDASDYHGIWMNEMRFPIDIVWLNEFNEVVYIKQNVAPETFPEVFTPTRPAKYVLEFNAGFVKANAIRVGDRFVLP